MFEKAARDKQARYSKTILGKKVSVERNYLEIDHNYTDSYLCVIDRNVIGLPASLMSILTCQITLNAMVGGLEGEN
jgi:hypothetical protein